jgi:hypothetical protein
VSFVLATRAPVGIEPTFRVEIQSRTDLFELDRSYNDNADELREKKEAVDAIVNPMVPVSGTVSGTTTS